jgi:predicted AlkP superfamily phosphohydrolase/phosphomutase
MDVYAEIDSAIGRIVAHVGDDVAVIVLSVTGMGPNYTGNFVLDEILRRLDGQQKTRSLDWLVRAKLRAKKILPTELRRRWRRTSRRIEERVAHADRERRRFFTVPHNDIAGAVRVNLTGREPGGLVHPDELDTVFEWLRKELLEIRNLDTDRPVVEDVIRIADHCAGGRIDDMPDFFVLWKRDARIERVGSPRIGEIVYRQRGNRTGDHNSDSVFFATGTGFGKGELEPVSLMDFAPTLAALADVPLPDCDGRPIDALLCGREPGSRA